MLGIFDGGSSERPFSAGKTELVVDGDGVRLMRMYFLNRAWNAIEVAKWSWPVFFLLAKSVKVIIWGFNI
jgi:hypothetical protein